ncbi:MAG: hypothetical protein ACHQ51_08655 [Elusimicrobiota bacterium]
MPRLLRLTVLTCLLAARSATAQVKAVTPPAPEVAAAQAQAQAVACAKQAGLPADACRQTLEVVAAYAAELKAAEQCLAKPCPVTAILPIFRTVQKLDEFESKLPDAARSDGTGRPLLRLSLLVARRAAAALAAADPKATPPFRFDPEVDAPRAVEAVCLGAAAFCADARAVLAETKALNERVAACADKPCAFDQLDAAAVMAEATLNRFMTIHAGDISTLTLFSVVSDANARLAGLMAKNSAASLAALNGGLSVLDKNLDAFKLGRGSADGFEADVGRLGGLYREASIGQDRVAQFLHDDAKISGTRDKINEAASHLAASRSRLLAMETARGLAGAAVADGTAVAGASPSAPSAKLRAMFTARAPGDESLPLLDRRTIPGPAPRDGKAPPILAQAPGPIQLLKNLSSDDPLKRADARRRVGLSSTVGDPSGRAALVHEQKYKDTCAIVSQQEVLTALHLLPTGDPLKQEDKLREEALARGFYDEGTPTNFNADLLVDRGVLVSKQVSAPLSALDAAVRRGGMVIATVDARYLWDIPATRPLGHAIVITGAEVDRFSGKTVGYYINDSGDDPPGRGRFVPVAQFQKAWDNHTRAYAEVR